jgi:hypothetical protein
MHRRRDADATTAMLQVAGTLAKRESLEGHVRYAVARELKLREDNVRVLQVQRGSTLVDLELRSPRDHVGGVDAMLKALRAAVSNPLSELSADLGVTKAHVLGPSEGETKTSLQGSVNPTPKRDRDEHGDGGRSGARNLEKGSRKWERAGWGGVMTPRAEAVPRDLESGFMADERGGSRSKEGPTLGELRALVLTEVAGVVEVEAVQAQNLPTVHLWTDAFCAVSLAWQAHASAVVPRSVQPIWNLACRFALRSRAEGRRGVGREESRRGGGAQRKDRGGTLDPQNLRVGVMHQGMGGIASELVGEVVVGLDGIEWGRKREVEWVGLTDSRGEPVRTHGQDSLLHLGCSVWALSSPEQTESDPRYSTGGEHAPAVARALASLQCREGWMMTRKGGEPDAWEWEYALLDPWMQRLTLFAHDEDAGGPSLVVPLRESEIVAVQDEQTLESLMAGVHADGHGENAAEGRKGRGFALVLRTSPRGGESLPLLNCRMLRSLRASSDAQWVGADRCVRRRP